MSMGQNQNIQLRILAGLEKNCNSKHNTLNYGKTECLHVAKVENSIPLHPKCPSANNRAKFPLRGIPVNDKLHPPTALLFAVWAFPI
jgi:hypothetical protein